MAKKISPSKLEIVSHCAAAFERCLPFPFEPSEASERGKDLHERTEHCLNSPESVDDILDDLNDSDKNAVKICIKVANKLTPKGPHRSFTEERLDLSFLGMSNGGTPDLAFFDEKSGTVCVIDWKFGHGPVPDPVENKQLMSYALGIRLAVRPEVVKQFYLVIVQPQAKFTESYRAMTIPATEFDKWEADIIDWVRNAMKPNPPATPGAHCKSCFCEAGKKGACPEFFDYTSGVKQEKQEKKEETARAVVAGHHPITVAGPAISFPIVIMSEEVVEKAIELSDRAFKFKVTDESSANMASILLNEIMSLKKNVDTNRQTVKRPILDLGTAIDDEAKRALIPLSEGQTMVKAQLDKYIADEKEKNAKVQREQETIRQQKQKEREKADEEARQLEEKARKEGSVKAADEARKAKERSDQKAKEEQEAEQNRQASLQLSSPKISGIKTKLVPEITVIDFEAMPSAFKMVNEKVLEAAVKSKSVTEKDTWLTIKWVEQSMSNGRGK